MGRHAWPTPNSPIIKTIQYNSDIILDSVKYFEINCYDNPTQSFTIHYLPHSERILINHNNILFTLHKPDDHTNYITYRDIIKYMGIDKDDSNIHIDNIDYNPHWLSTDYDPYCSTELLDSLVFKGPCGSLIVYS